MWRYYVNNTTTNKHNKIYNFKLVEPKSDLTSEKRVFFNISSIFIHFYISS